MENDLFHEYDIRGYTTQFSSTFVKNLSAALAHHFKKGNLVLAHDARSNSQEIYKTMMKELQNYGFTMNTCGLSSTPYFYHCINCIKADGGIIITASHLSPKYNGIKICGKNAEPISMKNGLDKIKNNLNKKPKKKKGTIKEIDCVDEYKKYFEGKILPLKIQIDASNGTGNIESNLLGERFKQANLMNQNPDMVNPRHSLNPLDDDAMISIKTKAKQYDFSVILDGDADRAIFVDDKARKIPTDVLGMLIAPKDTIIRDLTCTRFLDKKHQIITTKVGRTNIASAMKEFKAEFGFEKSGHIFFKDFYGMDNPSLATIKVAELILKKKKPLSRIYDEIPKYFSRTQKIESELALDIIAKNLQKKFRKGTLDYRDGITFQTEDAFVNIRKSNTEPVYKLTIESNTKKTLNKLYKATTMTKAL